MDINFHYFAIKTIAYMAGFNEADAQRIAEYSQFIDDYTVCINYSFREIPDYAESLIIGNDRFNAGYKVFETISTGFASCLGIARVAIDEEYQKKVVVPFHFIPFKNLNEFSGNHKVYRTIEADLSDDSLVTRLLLNAKDKCQESYGTSEYPYDIMRLGMLIHVFADTYAHQCFSGFEEWVNSCFVKEIKRTDTQKVVLDEYFSDECSKLPAIGHAKAGHAPDLTYASYEYIYAVSPDQCDKAKYTGRRNTNNTVTFLRAAKQIYTILYQIRNDNKNPSEEEWENLKMLLLQGFMTAGTDFAKLSQAWSRITNNDIEYHYGVKELWDSQLGEPPTEIEINNNDEESADLLGYYRTATDDFFHFNLIAKEIRDAVISDTGKIPTNF